MNKIIVNGALADPDQAISIHERGFRFGDGVFETIPIHAGKPYLWEYHLERLQAGLQALEIGFATQDLKAQAAKLLGENKLREGILRIYVSRGAGGRGYLPDREAKPTLVMETLGRPAPPARPVTLWLSRYEKISPRALPAGCKTAQGLNPTLARMEADGQGCHDALQCDARGHVAEASSANLFWRKGGTLYTPSPETGALAGVTRRRMIELSPYKVEEGLFTLDDLRDADAVMLTNATLGVVAVAALQPTGLAWDSAALTAEFQGLRNGDIRSA